MLIVSSRCSCDRKHHGFKLIEIDFFVLVSVVLLQNFVNFIVGEVAAEFCERNLYILKVYLSWVINVKLVEDSL